VSSSIARPTTCSSRDVGWPAIKATNLPARSAPPIAVPGIRVKAALSDNITAFGAVFNAMRRGPGDGDPQLRDNHGLAFRRQRRAMDHRAGPMDYESTSASRPLAGNFTPGAAAFRTIRRSALHRAGPVDRRPKRTASRQSFAATSDLRGRGADALSTAVSDGKGVSASLPGVTAFSRIATVHPIET